MSTPTAWRVTINPKYWDLERFQRDWVPGAIIAQSKGNKRMVTLPARNDRVFFVSKNTIVMRGTVLSDGFHTGTDHHEDPYNIGSADHRSVPEFTRVRVDAVRLSAPVQQGGRQTWTRFTHPAMSEEAPLSPVLMVTEETPAPTPPSPVLMVTEAPATGGAGTETPSPTDTEVATKAELLAMHREIKRQLAARRATETAERAAEKARKAERSAARAARAAEEAVRAAARAEKASAAASKL
jgi:hypothetical protein